MVIRPVIDIETGSWALSLMRALPVAMCKSGTLQRKPDDRIWPWESVTLAAAIANRSSMKPTDFHIGLEFLGRAGYRFRCTDVGSRTILAIRLDPDDDPNWHQGPPYIAKEMVFDEVALEACYLTHDDALRAALHAADTSGHPGYPGDVAFDMLAARVEDHYPHKGVLRFDRREPDGEILHPYAGRKEDEAWIVKLYLPFRKEYSEMPERDFIALPVATADDIRTRAGRGSAVS
jgi:hypothetical protein